MAISKDKKAEILADLKNAIDDSQSMVFVNFHGLTVGDTTELRNTLRGQGVNYRVAKKTLIRKSFEDSAITGELPELDGEIALAYGQDLVAPAAGIHTFAQDHKDRISILGGVFEGKFMNREEMNEIATIPPVPVLRGMFVNVINSPIQGLVVALGQIAETKSA